MRFVVDAMLGRLARWLRVVGFDALYPTHLDDDGLVELSNAEERILLTKDVALLREKKVDGYLIRSHAWEDQLVEVIDEFNLRDHVKPFSRCLNCNQLLVEISKKDVIGCVPALVYQCQYQFFRCDACQRVYWNGSHIDRMTAKLSKIIG
jgi:hypothetical protein